MISKVTVRCRAFPSIICTVDVFIPGDASPCLVIGGPNQGLQICKECYKNIQNYIDKNKVITSNDIID